MDIIIPGVPAEYAAIIYTIVGLISAALVGPLTALAKKWGRTSGVQTVTVSLALSALIAVGFAAWSAAQGGRVDWLGVIVSALIAFAKSNGDYLSRRNATKSGTELAQPLPLLAAPVVPEILPPAELIQPGDRAGGIPGLDQL
ncbi:hypothetical protein GCM10017784_35060 [Deinococcus indicus]|uniref:hypothetical protein n=1 Tax=Deinococcus indicus TaxID=223556 RepID=UPI00174AF7C9|nr:hypothetical protein [Deinococcus indicus]GHG37622.1 hypothetical protein GCM10017784_35060 [Deinococcus indicus]